MCKDDIYSLSSSVTSQVISSTGYWTGALYDRRLPSTHREAETCSLQAQKTSSTEECGPTGMKPGLFTQCKQEASDGCNKEN